MIRSVLTVAMLTSLMLVAGCDQGPSPLTEEQKLIGRAEREVRDQLNDPTSAQFDDVSASLPDKCVRGKVLAKNGFGAYAGYKKFVWRPMHVRFEPEPGDIRAIVPWLDAFTGCMKLQMAALEASVKATSKPN